MNDELYLLDSQEEMTVSSMMIVEGTENKRPGVLCEVEGPFMLLEKENNNDRWYTHSLIDKKILGSPYTAKMLENRTLYGEASHPSDRFDVKLPLISHSITNLWYNEDKSILMGRADVLDTPSGRIIYTLIQYGSKIGISVRARGKLVSKGGKNIPDEATYQFKTFDFVPNPGFNEARLNRVDESEDDIVTSFMNYVNEAPISDLGCVQQIFESADDSVFGEVKKALSKRLADNTLSQQEEPKVAEMLYEEAVKHEEDKLELEEKIEILNKELESLKSVNESLNEEVSTLKHEVGQKQNDVEAISNRLVSLTESEGTLKEEIQRLSGRVNLMTGKLKQYRAQSEDTFQKLEESEIRVEELQQKYNEAKDYNSEVMQKLEESEQKVNRLQSVNADTLKRLDEAHEQIVDITNRVADEKQEMARRRKFLPQGKSNVLNESIVDVPIETVPPVQVQTSPRRINFIERCSH